MSDIRELLEREVRPFAPPDAWEPVHRRAAQLHRRRRLGAAMVAFVMAGAGIGAAWLVTAGLHQTTERPAPATGATWDGGRILYPCRDMPGGFTDSEQPQLCTMLPDGSQRQLFAPSLARQLDGAWSPDGTRIVYRQAARPDCFGGSQCAASDLYVVDADGSNARELSSGLHASDLAWSPDGSLIAFDTDRGSIGMILAPDGGVVRLLTSGESSGFRDSSPTWSADGREMAFVRSPLEGLPELDVMNADGTNSREVVGASEVGGSIADPAWSPDGRFLAFAGTDSSGRSSLWEWDSALEGDPKNHPSRLWSDSGQIWNPEWIEGGAQIAFLYRNEASTDLVAIRFDGLDAPAHVEERQGPDGTQPVIVGSGKPRTIVAGFPGDQFAFQPPPGGAAGACADPGPRQFISCAQAVRRVADTPPSGSSITARLVRGSLHPGDEDRWVWAIVSHDVVSWIDPPPQEGPLFFSFDNEVDVDAETGSVVAEGRARHFGGDVP
jgi:Tol biopolymer transport system component